MAQESRAKLGVKNPSGGGLEELRQGLQIFAAGVKYFQEVISLQQCPKARPLRPIQGQGIEETHLPRYGALDEGKARVVGVRAFKFRVQNPKAVLLDSFEKRVEGRRAIDIYRPFKSRGGIKGGRHRVVRPAKARPSVPPSTSSSSPPRGTP